MTNKAGSGSESGSGSISQRLGSGSGSTPKWHGSATLLFSMFVDHFCPLGSGYGSESEYGSTTLELSQLIIDVIALRRPPLEFKGFCSALLSIR